MIFLLVATVVAYSTIVRDNGVALLNDDNWEQALK